MKDNRSIFVEWQAVILALAFVLYALLEPAYCQHPSDGTLLLLQQTPPQGGMINPRTGIHYFDLNAEVTLTAVPKPGYFFVYWMGDVSDPTANSTIVYLDTPKIVIAVFERSEYELMEEERLQNTLGRGGGLFGSPADYSNQGYSGGGAKRPEKPTPPPTPPPPPPPPTPPPTPDEFPVPVPEPATVLLLGAGSLLTLRRRINR